MLGLLAELRGAGAQFRPAAAFFSEASARLARDPRERGGAPPPHLLKVVVNRPPRQALPFARAAAASGVPALFLLPHGRLSAGERVARRPGTARIARGRVGERAGVEDPAALRALVRLGHELGLHADLAQLGDDVESALELATAPFAAAGLDLAAAGLRHDEQRPFDAAALDALGNGRRRPRGIRYCLDAACVAHGGERFVPTFAVTQVRERIHAHNLDPGYPIHVAALDALDAVTIAALVDTVARGVCVHELRLSSLA